MIKRFLSVILAPAVPVTTYTMTFDYDGADGGDRTKRAERLFPAMLTASCLFPQKRNTYLRAGKRTAQR